MKKLWKVFKNNNDITLVLSDDSYKALQFVRQLKNDNSISATQMFDERYDKKEGEIYDI